MFLCSSAVAAVFLCSSFESQHLQLPEITEKNCGKNVEVFFFFKWSSGNKSV